MANRKRKKRASYPPEKYYDAWAHIAKACLDPANQSKEQKTKAAKDSLEIALLHKFENEDFVTEKWISDQINYWKVRGTSPEQVLKGDYGTPPKSASRKKEEMTRAKPEKTKPEKTKLSLMEYAQELSKDSRFTQKVKESLLKTYAENCET